MTEDGRQIGLFEHSSKPEAKGLDEPDPLAVSEYESRREQRVERLRERAQKKRAEARAHAARSGDIAGRIPMGQPILVGHHSERRARRDQQKIHNAERKRFEALQEAEELQRRADRAERNPAIRGDDPAAVVKLREKVAALELERERAKRVNALYRKAARKCGERLLDVATWKAIAAETGVPERELARAIGRLQDYPWLKQPYDTSLVSATIRTTKQRIEELLEEHARAPAQPRVFEGFRLEEADNRLRFYFDEKPSDETRSLLKKTGFKWARSVEAWQRQITPNARGAMERLLPRLVEAVEHDRARLQHGRTR